MWFLPLGWRGLQDNGYHGDPFMFTPMSWCAGWKGFLRCILPLSELILSLKLCYISLLGGAVCILGFGVCGTECPRSEDQQRQPDRALTPFALLLGTVFTELHTGDRAGAEC